MMFDEKGRLVVTFGAVDAVDVDITDVGGYFVATEVESALQELGHLTALTVAEVDQLENLGDVTISYIQWGALGSLLEWTDWTPTLTGTADLSGYDSARYFRIGDICFFVFDASSKNVTEAGDYVAITLPFTAADTTFSTTFASINDGTSWIGAAALIVKNTNVLRVYKTAARGAWVGNETGVYIFVNSFFEII